MVIDQLVSHGKTRFPATVKPKFASGKCWEVSDDLVWKFSDRFSIIYAENPGDVDSRWSALKQYGNHYALKLDDADTVVDFTLRQFKEDVDWPFIGTVSQWLAILSEAWEVPEGTEVPCTEAMCPCLAITGGHYCECAEDLL